MNTDGFGDCMLPVLPLHRDAKGAWHRFPFFFTLLALIEMSHPAALDELRYALPECEKKLERLRPKDVYSERKFAVLERVLGACS